MISQKQAEHNQECAGTGDENHVLYFIQEKIAVFDECDVFSVAL